MREVRAVDPGHCLHRTLGSPFFLLASNKKLGSGGARTEAKRQKVGFLIFFLIKRHL